ncbi:MAG: glutamine--fructose-6-phosphate transaminase (isomerizing) [Nitrospinota bacterium]
MCGISGIVSLKNVTDKLNKSISNLEYRGYDSCGIAIINNLSKVNIKKNIGSVSTVSKKEKFQTLEGNVGIAHTRWATHGKVTKKNAHPHLSMNGKFIIVHNGIISNYRQLKNELLEKGYKFKSSTDTEVIVNMVESYALSSNSVEESFVMALQKLKGSFAITMIAIDEPDRLYCARFESPLIIGLGSDENYVGSDFNAFIEHTKSAVILDDSEYAIVTSVGYIIKSIDSGEQITRDIQKLEWDAELASKGGFPHYMLKEIYEQPEVIHNTLAIEQSSIDKFADTILTSGSFYLTGVGTTFFVTQLAQYYFSQYANITPISISSDEFKYLSSLDNKSFLLAVTQSGETYDTLSALRFAKAKGAKTGAIVNVLGSSTTRLVDLLLVQGSGPEISVISTKAAVAQMIILTRIAITAGLKNGTITYKEFQKFNKEIHLVTDIIKQVLNEHSGIIHNIAKKHIKIKHWLYLGRGKYYPIAVESALKMKEVSYIHAEGMPSGFLKHGAIALIDKYTNSIVFTPTLEEEDLYHLTLSSVAEVRARDGYVLGIAANGFKYKNELFSDIINLPATPAFTAPFVELIAAQLFSYYSATALDRNVDRPRSLAKSVTVA